MSMSMSSFNVILKHTWTEPRFVAEMEWGRLFSLGAQLFGQVPREELETYVETGRHPNPDRRVSLVMYDEPDWDWWEPTSRWRRMAARERDLDAKLARLSAR